MEAAAKKDAQSPDSRTEKLQEKKDRFTWWQSLLLLAGTLIICLVAGYFISSKFIWSQNDQLTKQLKYYKAQVDKSPNDPNLRVQLGYTYLEKQDLSDAINQFNTAKTLDKNNYGAWLNLAIAYDQENQPQNCLNAATTAVKLSPNDYKPLLLEGRSYRKLKLYSQAITALQQADRFKPDNDDITFEAGLVAEDEGNKSQAESIFKQVLSYDPTYTPATNELNKLEGNSK